MKSSITIGVLDGVHLGHRALLAHLDRSMRRTVLTFEPHPIEVLRPGTHPRLITTLEERTGLLHSLGVDRVVALDLGTIKDLAPADFVSRHLVDEMDVGHLVVGSDFRFGRDRAGDIELLRRLATEGGWKVEAIDLVADEEAAISSSRVRSLIEGGEIIRATSMLGSHFVVTGEVVHGDKRGREIGFPTANMRPPERKVIPATGVYACFATVGGTTHQAAVNVGYRPTFDGTELLVEAYILDFDEEIYGETIAVHFVQRLRPELKFESVESLVGAMTGDVARAREVLEATAAPNMS